LNARIIAFLTIGFHSDMLSYGPEILRQSGVIIMADLLVAKEQNLKLCKGLLKLNELDIAQWLGQVYTAHGRAY
jgi:hypothetical protein